MFRINFIIISFLFSLISVHSAPVCTTKQRFLKQSLRPASHLDFYEQLSKVLPATQIIILGEHHIYSNRLIYDSILRKIKQTDVKYDCLFLEGDRGTIDGYSENIIHGMVSTIALAKEANMRIIELEPQLLRESSERESLMASVIQDNLANNKCSKAVAIIGASHLGGIGKLLAKLSISTTSFSLIPDQSYSIYIRDNVKYPMFIYTADIYNKAFCVNEAPYLTSPIAFRAQSHDPFDYYMLYPVTKEY